MKNQKFEQEMMKVMAEAVVEAFGDKLANASEEQLQAWVENNKESLCKGAAMGLDLAK